MKRYLPLVLLLNSILVYGQPNVPFNKENFKDNIKGYEKAMDSMDAGRKLYEMGPSKYYVALPYYLSAEKFNPNNDQLNYLIGACMLADNSSCKTKALPYLEKAYKLNPDVKPDILYQLARAYHLNMVWDKARNEYNAYLQTLDKNKNQLIITDIKKKIEECNNGEELVKHPDRVFIDNLGPTINTQYSEYSPVITADESELIFTSMRPVKASAKVTDEDDYREAIYVSYYKDSAWTEPLNMGLPVNPTNNDAATAGLSYDGQILYIYHSSNGGDIYESHLNGLYWSKPLQMDPTINSVHQETSASLGPDQRTLYFVSDRPGGFGGKDIYKSIADGNGNWHKAENLGPVINTKYDEEGVYLQADGKTLYFSSKGHNTMGGYDIFKSVYDSGHWSVPENLGYPINTPDDDLRFSISASGKHAYYSSIREGGYGGYDLYMVTFLGPEKPVVQSNEDNLLAGYNGAESMDVTMVNAVSDNTPKVTLLKGIIRDSATHKPIKASIELVDNKKNAVIANFQSNSTTGKYLISLPEGINYGIAVKAEGYLFYSDNFNISDTSNYTVVEKDVALQPIDIGSSIVLHNIFFDVNKSALNSESATEIDRIANLLKTHPSVTIEISGFTDSQGSDTYNQKLSEARAKSVLDYLVAHGIAPSRLTSKGYGKEHPVASNDTEEGRKQNRRTEFKITGK